ncbi:MAG: hypothetical protein ABIC91_08370 [Nanoarchaeota archaeon]|nr:hypothetical protein [Nanoarchaeota archaeon]MBU1030348.1 hypothetical protein [Nanoarchaeota archaeon]MBU1849808.1 hypothetical protein [Nanoarchaeota archaeon]
MTIDKTTNEEEIAYAESLKREDASKSIDYLAKSIPLVYAAAFIGIYLNPYLSLPMLGGFIYNCFKSVSTMKKGNCLLFYKSLDDKNDS